MSYDMMDCMAEPIGGRLSEAFRQTYEAAGVSQLDIAAELDVDQPTVSKWARGMRRPPLDALPVTERLAGVPKGTILRRAGYVDEVDNTVEAAIHADPGLDPDDKNILLGMVNGFRVRHAAHIARETLEPDLDDPDEAELWGLTSYSEAERRQLIQGLRDVRAQRPPRRRRRRAG